jgi:hypothetical protein
VKRVAELVLAALALELVMVVVSGGASLLDLRGETRVTPAGFLARGAALALALLLRFGALASGRADRARLFLVLLLLPTLAQLHVAGGRLGGDGISYYVYVRSLLKDADLDFTNEYTHFGWIERGDLRVPTKTGLRRSIFPVGPGLVFAPFFLLGEAVGRLQAAAGAEVDLSGYGDVHVNAVALGGMLFGFAAVVLTHALLRRHFREGEALLAAVLVWLATFLHFYMTQNPVTSHAPTAAAAALILLVWEGGRLRRSPGGYLGLGLLLGFAMCLRWQSAVFLLLPGAELLRRVLREGLPLQRAGLGGGLLALGMLAGAAPQMLAWKALYGVFVLPAPPHGTDFLRLDHPYLMNTLFSSRHGLLAWTPVLWAGFLGFLPLLKRRPAIAVPLLAPLLVMTWVNACSGDWWAGGSFSNRRFDSLLPLLALGLAAALESVGRLLDRRAEAALALAAAPFILWNGLLVEQVRRGLVPRDDTVDGPALVGQAARLLTDAVGFPTTWPASWLFAARTGLPVGQYDRLVGRYLFYRQNNLGGYLEIGEGEDAPMLGEGFGPPRLEGGVSYRETRGRARVMAPLDVPEDIEVRVRAAAPGGETLVTLVVNGQPVGRFRAGPEFAEHALEAPAALWRRELNDVVIEPMGVLRVDAVSFRPRSRAR